jgi:Glycosyltransferase family 87
LRGVCDRRTEAVVTPHSVTIRVNIPSRSQMPDHKSVKFIRLLLVALLAVSLIFHLKIIWESRKQIAAGYGDFIIFYTGAQIINDGKSKELFKVETQNAYQAKFSAPLLEWPLPFNHAPYELFLFLPLVHLSYPVAHAVWSGVNLLLLAIILWWLLLYCHSPHSFFIGISLLGFFPTMEVLRLGQDSILSTALLLAVFAALKRKRDVWAGFLLALGLYKPQLVLPLAGVFLVARSWRSLISFGISGAMLVAISLAVVGQQGAYDLVSILKVMDRYSFVVRPALMPNLRGFMHILIQGENVYWLTVAMTVAISVAIYAVCLYLCRVEFDVLDPTFDLKFSLILVTTLLISYHLYAHDLFLLVLPLILFFCYVTSGHVTRRILSNTFFLLLVTVLFPLIPHYLVKFSAFGWWVMPILLLYLILSVEISSRGRRAFAASQLEGKS